MTEVMLTGLDGSNPLGFMAALGALTVATEQCGAHCRLGWVRAGTWRPVLHGVDSWDALLDATLADRDSWRGDPALELTYDSKGRMVYDLKPDPEVYQRYLEGLLDTDASEAGARSLAVAAAFATDVVFDNVGKIKPTALHFTAGQQLFLDFVRQLRDQITREDLAEALRGPWSYESKLPTLRWDAGDAREYALRATDPSADKKLGVPGADWLGFRGISCFPVFPKRSKRGLAVKTTAVFGGWKRGTFRWSIWSPPASMAVVKSMLLVTDLGDRDARGIEMVYESKILRSAQGGYGNFTPARVI